jgi:PIN domain nuclease of toxin-antitoxin system
VRLLLDTHVFLWAAADPDRLAADVREAICDPGVPVHVSAVTAWELAIKQSLGKIILPGPVDPWLFEAVEALRLAWLPVAPQHAVAVARLPWLHRDPFDRLLVAQCLSGHTLVTADEMLAQYAADVWVTSS